MVDPIPLPANVRLGPGTLLTGDQLTSAQIFRKFRSQADPAIVIGARCMLDGVLFNLGEKARVSIGDDCQLEEVFLIAEQEIRVGNRVLIGWRTTIVDADLHPMDLEQRLVDAVAISPFGRAEGRSRPPFACQAVEIGDDVWIGPNTTILKGVHIGSGAFVEPGSVVTKDVAPRAHVLGNPAHVIGGL